jgi:nitrogen fixation protein NifZ
MTEPVVPRFQWGQRVQAIFPLYNDGTFPEFPAQALLVQIGDAGEIVQVGTHVDSNTTVYMVEFGPNRVVGCLEQEIAAI